MSLADDLKPLVASIRGIPGELGLRPHRVFLSTSEWSDSAEVTTPGDGYGYTTEVEFLENGHPPKVRQLNDERLALGGLAAGSVEIGPITTGTEVAGISVDEILGADLRRMSTLTLRITGPSGDMRYTISKAVLDRAMHWMLTASPMSVVSPDA